MTAAHVTVTPGRGCCCTYHPGLRFKGLSCRAAFLQVILLQRASGSTCAAASCTGRDTARKKHSMLWVDGELYSWASSTPRVGKGEDANTVSRSLAPCHSVDFDQMSHQADTCSGLGGQSLDIHMKPG